MTQDWEPCQLVPNKVNDSSMRALPHWQRDYGSQIKKRQTKPNPNDSWQGPCQLVPNMANDSSIRALPHWQRDYGSQIK